MASPHPDECDYLAAQNVETRKCQTVSQSPGVAVGRYTESNSLLEETGSNTTTNKFSYGFIKCLMQMSVISMSLKFLFTPQYFGCFYQNYLAKNCRSTVHRNRTICARQF